MQGEAPGGEVCDQANEPPGNEAMRLIKPLRTLPSYFVEQNSRCHGGIQGSDPAGHRDSQEQVAFLADDRRDPATLGTEDQCEVDFEVGLRVRGRAGRDVGARYPEPGVFERPQALRDVRDPDDRDVRGRAGRGFADGRVYSGAASLRDDDGVRAGRFSRADDRAQIVRVGDVIEHDK